MSSAAEPAWPGTGRVRSRAASRVAMIIRIGWPPSSRDCKASAAPGSHGFRWPAGETISLGRLRCGSRRGKPGTAVRSAWSPHSEGGGGYRHGVAAPRRRLGGQYDQERDSEYTLRVYWKI